MGAPLPRPISIARPLPPLPQYRQFQSVYTSTTERIADYFGGFDGDSSKLSAKEARSAANYLRQRADELSFSSYSKDAKLANVYEAYATVFENLTRALVSRDPIIDTMGDLSSSISGGDGQLNLGIGRRRFGSELRDLAGRVGTQDVLSFRDFTA